MSTKKLQILGSIPKSADDIGAVSYDAAQTLTDEQKNQARENIGAAPSSHASDTSMHITDDERTAWNAKQNALSGTQGQVVGFDASGNPIAQDFNFDSSSIIEQNKGLPQKFWRGTQAEYEDITTKSDDTMYIITDDDGMTETPGNMNMSVYDPQGKAQDVFAYADNSVRVHTANTGIHVTAEEKAAWNAKADAPIKPADIGAVNKSGDTMTGNLTIRTGALPAVLLRSNGAGYTDIYKNNSSTVEDGTHIQDVDIDGNSATLKITRYKGVANCLQLDVDGTVYPVYHTGNKPTLMDIAFLGQNPITQTTDDTTANWTALGSGYAWYNASGQLTNQPSTYGFLISYVQNGDVFQIWNAQAGGPTYFRSGNAAGWNNSWRKIYDTSNKPTPDEIGAASTSYVDQKARTAMNRTTNVNVADANYTTYMARGEALFNAETNPTVNGTIAWMYE